MRALYWRPRPLYVCLRVWQVCTSLLRLVMADHHGVDAEASIYRPLQGAAVAPAAGAAGAAEGEVDEVSAGVGLEVVRALVVAVEGAESSNLITAATWQELARMCMVASMPVGLRTRWENIHCGLVEDSDEQRQDAVLRLCSRLLGVMMGKEPAVRYFNAPVDPEALNIPEYFGTVKEPMDLGTIRKRLQQGYYSPGSQLASGSGAPVGSGHRGFGHDVRLVFSNCIAFNGQDSSVGRAAGELRALFDTSFQNEVLSVAAQIAVERALANAPKEDGGDEAAVLRSRRVAEEDQAAQNSLLELVVSWGKREFMYLSLEEKLAGLVWLCDRAASCASVRACIDASSDNETAADLRRKIREITVVLGQLEAAAANPAKVRTWMAFVLL